MTKVKTKNSQLRQAVKDVMLEMLTKDRKFLRKVLLEAIDDLALGELLVEARKDTKKVPRNEVFKILEGRK
jgi:hypothetical protein